LNALEATLRLDVRDYVDERIEKELKRRTRPLIWVLMSLAAVVGLGSMYELPVYFRKIADDYFREQGYAQLEDTIRQLNATLEDGKNTLANLKLHEQALEQLNAAMRVQALEAKVDAARTQADNMRFGATSVSKGSAFSVAVGPTIMSWTVRDIKMGDGEVTVSLRGPGTVATFDEELTATYIRDLEFLIVDPKPKRMRTGATDDVAFAVAGVSSDSVSIAYRVTPRKSPTSDVFGVLTEASEEAALLQELGADVHERSTK
jgi:hypothetical protein